jgi:hypothetical protein
LIPLAAHSLYQCLCPSFSGLATSFAGVAVITLKTREGIYIDPEALPALVELESALEKMCKPSWPCDSLLMQVKSTHRQEEMEHFLPIFELGRKCSIL